MKLFEKLITVNTGTSSKRFISLVCTFALVAVIAANVYGMLVPEIIYFTLSGLILGNSVLGTFQKSTPAAGDEQPTVEQEIEPKAQVGFKV